MLDAVGIICEYNPFHNGHAYHLNKIKEMFPNSTIILVMSGYFTQRGDISILSKKEKTKIALQMGIDIVVELPFAFATQSADIFASGAIQILNNFKVNKVVFGSECNDIKKLKKLADIQSTNKFNNLVKSYLNNGINYPTATSKALKEISNIHIKEPNDLLAISYIKCIKRINNKIEPITIKRTNDFHSLDINNSIISATAIRDLLSKSKDISNYVPKEVLTSNIKYICLNDYFDLIKYNILLNNNFNNIQTVDEGIEYRILKNINSCKNVYELIEKVKTKRYTYNRIKRMLVHILCSFTKDEAHMCKNISYIRLLGFNKKGQNYLSKIKKESKVPIITKLSTNNDQLNIDKRVMNIYNLKSNNHDNEYKDFPIIFN